MAESRREEQKARNLAVSGLLKLVRLGYVAMAGAVGALVAYVVTVKLSGPC